MKHMSEHEMRQRRGVHSDRCQTVEEYADVRINILERDFMIKLTDEEKDHVKSLKTETAVDAAIRAICKKRWEED